MLKNNIFAITFIIYSLFMGCGMQLGIPHKAVSDADIVSLSSDGFTHLGATNILEMQNMSIVSASRATNVSGVRRNKLNVCGLDSGTRAGFLLNPREAFYDLTNPPSFIFYGDGTLYDKLIKEYPIMRSKDFPDHDVGLLPHSLAEFWSKQFKYHKAEFLGFNKLEQTLQKVKEEIKAGRPVLLNVLVSGNGVPVFMPDHHLGPRTFFNSHWVVVVGFNEHSHEWLIRDNGGLYGTINKMDALIIISENSLAKIANVWSLAEDLKLYIDEPNLPIFLDDADDDAAQTKLRKDFELIKAYNIVVFSRK